MKSDIDHFPGKPVQQFSKYFYISSGLSLLFKKRKKPKPIN